MAYVGQPVPSTTYNAARAKISDGKSVRVKVTGAAGGTTIEAGKFYLLSGFFGVAMQSVTLAENETADVILNIEQAEYETDQIDTQIDTTASASYAVGTEVYWNGTLITTAAEDGAATPPTPYRKVGRITASKDDNNVIWFILGPQV